MLPRACRRCQPHTAPPTPISFAALRDSVRASRNLRPAPPALLRLCQPWSQALINDPGPLLPALCGWMPRPSAIMAPSVAWPSCRWPDRGPGTRVGPIAPNRAAAPRDSPADAAARLAMLRSSKPLSGIRFGDRYGGRDGAFQCRCLS